MLCVRKQNYSDPHMNCSFLHLTELILLSASAPSADEWPCLVILHEDYISDLTSEPEILSETTGFFWGCFLNLQQWDMQLLWYICSLAFFVLSWLFFASYYFFFNHNFHFIWYIIITIIPLYICVGVQCIHGSRLVSL